MFLCVCMCVFVSLYVLSLFAIESAVNCGNFLKSVLSE